MVQGPRVGPVPWLMEMRWIGCSVITKLLRLLVLLFPSLPGLLKPICLFLR